MKKPKKIVASVDTSLSSKEIASYLDGLTSLVEQRLSDGFEPYIMTFMFKLARLAEGVRAGQVIEGEVSRVYARFLTECVRHPWSQGNANNRPVLIGCRDWPVNKSVKQDRLIALPWEGEHWAGILLVPPINRFKTGVKQHFEHYRRSAYIRSGHALSRIHIEHITYRPSLAVEYTFKSLTRRRCSIDDVLICPAASCERAKQ
jgi:hypothetical protein